MKRIYINFTSVIIIGIWGMLCANAENEDLTPNVQRSRWAVEVQYDLNMPGDWRTTSRSQSLNLSSGIGVGGACNVNLSRGWFIEPGALIAYDVFKFRDSDDNLQLRQVSFRIPIKAGYEFDAWDDFKILPHIAVEGVYNLYNKLISKTNSNMNYRWNKFDVLCGVGIGFKLGSYGVDVTGYFGLIDKLSSTSDYHPQYKQYSNKVAITAKYFF